MIVQALIILFLGIVVGLIALLTGVVGRLWLLLFKKELSLPFGGKNDAPSETDR
ncbi:hypothetical protein M1555_05715 [Patescibacteria group bacterium]|nr:hypothetical protein [Patescibacteria group bacterium]